MIIHEGMYNDAEMLYTFPVENGDTFKIECKTEFELYKLKIQALRATQVRETMKTGGEEVFVIKREGLKHGKFPE